MNSDDPNFALSDIGQIGLTVSDLEKAVAFYRDALGMKHLFNAPPSMAFFAAGNVRLMLSSPEKLDPERFGCALYFKVADIQGAYAKLTERGVQFEEAPIFVANMGTYDLWLASFRDSENNLLALMAHVPKVK